MIIIRIIIILGVFITGIFFSGCVSNSPEKPLEQVSPTGIASSTSNQVPQSIDQNKVNELEAKINSMQTQMDEMQTRINRLDLLKPSTKSLIPQVPFRIEVKWAEWQIPLVYTFKENEVEIKDSYGEMEIASYKLYRNNNTIKINSKKYDYYGIVLYDDYATAIYENGWMSWVKKYTIIPPKFNTETQKYELN
ncbi:Uncharacterised protein [uncultured archaeon]|nr:Uncharacterised protein [uncultured archaeon]